MLQANSKKGKLVTPAMLSTGELEKLRISNEVFYCPVCNEKVILRAGTKVIAHFAHLAKTKCLTASGEGVYHEQGKLMLYHWLLNQGIKVELEKFIPEINQRPDLYIQLVKKSIVLEYQCATISSREIIERTKGYEKIGVHVIWILGAKQLKRSSNQILKINSFSKTMIHQFSSDYPPSIFYYCPLRRLFIKYQDLSFLSNHRTTGKLSIVKENATNLNKLLQGNTLPKRSLLQVWQQEKKRFRLRPRGRIFGRELAWYQWLYFQQLHLDNLPSYVYLPVKNDYMMKRESWIWQSRLVIDIIAPLKTGQNLSGKHCIFILRNHIANLLDYPLVRTKENPILHYLRLLTQIGLLEQISEDQFRKIKDIELHPNIDTAIKADEMLLNQLFGK